MISSFKDPKDKKSYDKQPFSLSLNTNNTQVKPHHSSNPTHAQKKSEILPLDKEIT